MYESFVTEGSTQGRRKDLYQLRDQRILGDETFYKQVSRRQKREEGDIAESPVVHFELDELEKIMGKILGTESGPMKAGRRFGTWIRRIFCYMARTYGAHKGKDVATYLGKDLATVTYNVRFIENLLRKGDPKTTNAIKRVL